MTANITTPYSEEISMLFGLCSRTGEYKSTNENVKTFLSNEFNNKSTQDLSSIIDKLIKEGFANKDFKNALFCTEYDLHKSNLYKVASNIWLYSGNLCILGEIVDTFSLFFVSHHTIDTICVPALFICLGVFILGYLASAISLYYQNSSKLDELNTFFKSQNVQVGSSDNSSTNIISNERL